MKRKLLTGIVTLTVCISMFAATNMCIKLEDGQIVKYDVENVVEVYYETNINDTTPPLIDSFIVDASETSLEFRILSDTTAEVAKGDQDRDLDTLNIPSNVRIDGKVYKVTSIGDSAFYESTYLKSITIPKGVTIIGSSTFEGCSSLESITIPEGVKSIESFAFASCN